MSRLAYRVLQGALLAIAGLASVLLVGSLTGCDRPAPAAIAQEGPKPAILAPTAPDVAIEASVAAEPLPAASQAVSDTVTGPIAQAVATVSQVLPPAPPPPPVEAPVAAAAVALIVRWEITSPGYYARRLAQPVWPGGASGVTWCIGYDGGHQTVEIILQDWPTHGHRTRLATTAGVTGQKAKLLLPRFRDITTPYADCVHVFETRTLIEYERRTRRAFGQGYTTLRPNARGALVSLVYNRGASMTGDNRREMKHIRDVCVPAQDYGCIAAQIRSMKRLWKGTTIQDGMNARREAEALLTEET